MWYFMTPGHLQCSGQEKRLLNILRTFVTVPDVFLFKDFIVRSILF